MSAIEKIKDAVGLGESADANTEKAGSAEKGQADAATRAAAAADNDPKAAAAAKKPDAPIASGTVRAGAVAEEDKTRIDPLEGTQYANNAVTGGVEIHLRLVVGSDNESVRSHAEKLIGALEEGGEIVEFAEMRSGSPMNPQIEPLLSPKRRKEAEQAAKTAEKNAERVAADTEREQAERRDRALRGGRR